MVASYFITILQAWGTSDIQDIGELLPKAKGSVANSVTFDESHSSHFYRMVSDKVLPFVSQSASFIIYY